jgi:zinc transporter ZupT
MLGFAESFLPWTAATLIPAFVGLLLIVWAEGILTAIWNILKKTWTPIKSFLRRPESKADRSVAPSPRRSGTSRCLAAFASGILFWFLVDTATGAASLDVNSGFSGGLGQIAIVGLFVIGVLSIFSIDRNRNIFSPQLAIGKYGLAIPVLVALALGIHGLGEGAAFGGTAALTKGTSLLNTFGGISGGVAYVLHKAFEPMIIGACYYAYSIQHAKNNTGRLRDIAILSAIFAIPSLIGAVTGYYLTYDSSYFYALGTGTAIYAAVRLFGPMFDNSNPTSPKESITMAALMTLGLLTIYFAALFHSG